MEASKNTSGPSAFTTIRISLIACRLFNYICKMKTKIFVALCVILSLTSCYRCKTCTTVSTTLVTDKNGKNISNSVPAYDTYKACGSHLKEVDGETITTIQTIGENTYTTTGQTT